MHQALGKRAARERRHLQRHSLTPLLVEGMLGCFGLQVTLRPQQAVQERLQVLLVRQPLESDPMEWCEAVAVPRVGVRLVRKQPHCRVGCSVVSEIHGVVDRRVVGGVAHQTRRVHKLLPLGSSLRGRPQCFHGRNVPQACCHVDGLKLGRLGALERCVCSLGVRVGLGLQYQSNAFCVFLLAVASEHDREVEQTTSHILVFVLEQFLELLLQIELFDR
mmetsp:Transcript_71159/g.231143  ORF Transcript_71159/g.231143 Transcript_71159/m.231143 type:complete len:219 (+) Transcript_71159:3762-4418(+)